MIESSRDTFLHEIPSCSQDSRLMGKQASSKSVNPMIKMFTTSRYDIWLRSTKDTHHTSNWPAQTGSLVTSAACDRFGLSTRPICMPKYYSS